MSSLSRKNLTLLAIIFICITITIYFHKQYFIENYMRYRLRHSNIIVSFSTTPYRIGRIFSTIDYITKQNAPISKIYLNIPHIFARDNLEYIIPKWLEDNQNITLLRTKDYGPATKLLGVLEQVDMPQDTIIVTLDDDIKYKNNVVLHLAYSAMLNPDKAIGISGANLYAQNEIKQKYDISLGLKTRYNTNELVTVLQGYAGIAYRRHFFTDDIYNINDLPTFCIQSDDIYLSFYLAKNNISRQSLANKFVYTTEIRSDPGLALHHSALQQLSPLPATKNELCSQYLQQQYPNIIFAPI